MRRKITLFIALLSLLGCISLIQATYAKYITSATADTNLSIAKWSVKINNKDIIHESDFTETITPSFYTNENIKDGVVAPTSKGYFNLILDGTDTDVSYKYVITIEKDSDSSIDDLSITGATINNEDITYTGIIEKSVSASSNQKIDTVKLEFEWDDENGTLDNFEDVKAAKGVELAKFKIHVQFIQLQD